MIDLREIFLSIQGESTYSGLPCIFIRLAGCNLRCSYCDTVYSYEKSLSLDSAGILQKISKYEPVKLVEITGGEPLLQNQVYSLIASLYTKGYRILLETNGSLSLEKTPGYVKKIVDVKCPGSSEQNSFLLSNLQYLKRDDELKFVLTDYDDYCFAKEFIKTHQITNIPVHFSPVTTTLSPERLAEWILKDRLAVRLHLQIHKLIWGSKEEGVF
jgi:7-carboxy-7-deazaguanine synthase